MQQIVVDMHMAEVIINSDPNTFRTNEEKKTLYQSVFDKHRVTEAVYDNSLIWYGKNLDVFMQVYNMALTDVKKRIEEIGPIELPISYNPNKDSVNIWRFGDYYEFSPASLSNSIIFHFQEIEEFSSGSIFVLGMHVWGIPPSGMFPPIEIHLRAEQSDTTIIERKNIQSNGYHEMILRSVPTKKVRQVHGFIRLNGHTLPYNKIYIDNLKMMKYFYGSEVVENNW